MSNLWSDEEEGSEGFVSRLLDGKIPTADWLMAFFLAAGVGLVIGLALFH